MLIRSLLATCLLALALAGCQAPLLSGVAVSSPTITPNGDRDNDLISLSYVIAEPARVSIVLRSADGGEYWLRRDEPRAPGSYAFRFDGTAVPPDAPLDRRVVQDGEYTWTVRAVPDRSGPPAEVSGTLRVIGADVTAPHLEGPVVEPGTITPNGDGRTDEADISYGLSKAATVEIYATDAAGHRYVIQAPAERTAALHSHRWNGTINGRLVEDGEYTIHVAARDAAGNVTDRATRIVISQGGTPRLVITSARFTPRSVPRGGWLDVAIVVRNVGDVPLATLGPPPGTPYTTQMNFNSFRDSSDPNAPPQFFERTGVWRVGVDWENSGRPYPVRWALFKDLDAKLLPGQEATITGSIQVLIDQTPSVVFWASVVQEGVGFPGGRVGLTRITISY